MFVKFAIRVFDSILSTRFKKNKIGDKIFPKPPTYFKVQLMHAGLQGCY